MQYPELTAKSLDEMESRAKQLFEILENKTTELGTTLHYDVLRGDVPRLIAQVRAYAEGRVTK